MKQTVFWISILALTGETHAGALGRIIAVGSGQTFGKYFTLGGAIALAVLVIVLAGVVGYLVDHFEDD